MASDQATQKAPGPGIAAPTIGGVAHDAAALDPSAADAAPLDDTAAAFAALANASTNRWSSWSNLWQMPTIVLSVALIGIGLYASMRPPAKNDFDGAMKQIDQFIAAGEFEQAEHQLREMVEPHLLQATLPQQARFHATSADLTSAIQSVAVNPDQTQYRRIIEEYTEAEKLGLTLEASRVERLANACVLLGDFDAARHQLARLDALEQSAGREDAAAAETVHAGRNRVFRLLVETSLRRPDVQSEDLMRTLTEYRGNQKLAGSDEFWAIAQQAEIRLQSGQTQKAVESLLVDMRRLESRGIATVPSDVGELYTLLGRGYFELGDYQRATSHLAHAMEQFAGTEPARGDALVLLGRIALAQSDPDTAHEKFHTVVRDCIGTPAYLPGILGRAETQSILGDHEHSLADYQMLGELLSTAGPRRDISPQLVAQSLCNRHDAALALGKLDRAIEYATLAETFFKPEQVPDEVLVRLASTHRQMADNMVANTGVDPTETSHGELNAVAVDPEIRNQANAHYEKAGEYYLRHTAGQSEQSVAENDWFASLWLAADSYDRGGRQDLAIRNFDRYLEASPIDDQHRAETLYRLGRAHHAELNYERAIKAYEQVLNDSPRSTFAAHVHVPLAQCYLAVNRRPEAEQQLRQVLAGDRLLKPDADDYCDALIELGTIAYENNEFIAAIEHFSEAMERYPDDRRRLEVNFRLADSYRSNAAGVEERLKQPPPLPPAEQNRLTSLRTEQLQKSLELFAQLAEANAPEGKQRLNPLQQDMVRRAHLYRADCEFHLSQFELAIELYDRAARLYSAHASSMYALVQIVNCYNKLGDADRAAAAHHRALVRLKQLPDTAFDATDSLMDRTAWEKWLESSPISPARTAAASASP